MPCGQIFSFSCWNCFPHCSPVVAHLWARFVSRLSLTAGPCPSVYVRTQQKTKTGPRWPIVETPLHQSLAPSCKAKRQYLFTLPVRRDTAFWLCRAYTLPEKKYCLLSLRAELLRIHCRTKQKCSNCLLVEVNSYCLLILSGSPASTMHWPNDGLRLARRLWRRPSIKPAFGTRYINPMLA